MADVVPEPAVDDLLRVAIAAHLARYKGLSRVHTGSDLQVFLRWCAERELEPLRVRRPDVELFVRWLEEIRRFKPSTVARRLSVVQSDNHATARSCRIEDVVEACCGTTRPCLCHARIPTMTPRLKIAGRLTDAVDSATLVRVSRSPRNADRVDGFLLAVGSKWVLIAQTGDGGFFDGLVAVRVQDVVKVKHDSSFEGEFARTQPEWPPTAPVGMDLATTRGLIEAMSQVSPVVGIEQERRYGSAMRWIGVVDEIRQGWLWLHEVRSDATWHTEPLGYKLSRITKVTVADRYQTALATIAGTRPRSHSA